MIKCVKTDSPTTAAAASIDLDACRDRFSEVTAAIAGRFPRVEPRRHATAFLRALMAGPSRANCWTLAEHAGYRSPDAFQYLLAQSVWDHDGLRDDLRTFVVDHLGRDRAVLVLDETGDVKKGVHTVGVQRQYTGTAGRIENAQVAVYAVWAGRRSAAFIDRELYVPRSWTADPARCAAAGLPEDLVFATKPALALRIVQRTVAADAVPGFVTGDEVYGNDPRLRAGLEQLGIGYVLAVASTATVALATGPVGAAVLAAGLPEESWQLRSAGQGSKGQRWYQWAYLSLEERPPAGGGRYLLIRRNRTTGELAFYRCWTPARATLAELVRVAGTRWRVEEAFQTGKVLTALDEHQVRRYTSWARWTVLAMLAHAFLTVLAAEQPAPEEDTGMIALTRNETAHLLAALLFTHHHPEQHRWAWSAWRRRHQLRARHCHYQRQQTRMQHPAPLQHRRPSQNTSAKGR
ncbi:IS701 family transposase [Catenulispora subtropica]|uniref:IS701 family transposase n=1 Tax=Catenulispora subtropica TaxID=450798 RepID=A0ABN2QWQ4_9ACTN